MTPPASLLGGGGYAGGETPARIIPKHLFVSKSLVEPFPKLNQEHWVLPKMKQMLFPQIADNPWQRRLKTRGMRSGWLVFNAGTFSAEGYLANNMICAASLLPHEGKVRVRQAFGESPCQDIALRCAFMPCTCVMR